MTGRFIVLEGCDGCGKTTQVGRLVRRLEAQGHSVVATFEPGATELGQALRELLLGDEMQVSPRAEALLMAADRAQHVNDVIAPALARGTWVVSDRFVGSSLAYQGAARASSGLVPWRRSASSQPGVSNPTSSSISPRRTTCCARAAPVVPTASRPRATNSSSSVARAYDVLAAARGWAVVDATADPDVVEDAVWDAVERRVSA